MQTATALDIQEYISWFNDLNSRYNFGDSEWAAIHKNIASLEKRSSDRTLYLGIVGEFSSGKSTFINALLRDDLLKSDILAATTCALTYLEYGDKLEARIVFSDGTQLESVTEHVQTDGDTSISPESIQAIRQAVQKYTADEQESKRVSHVSIRYPNEQLRRGIAIIDTPGINVESKRHAEITENALVGIFDACIIVIPAIAPCSEVLINFLNSHIAAHNRECIVVVTKIDLIRPTERARLMRHIAGTIKAQTTLRVAAIYDMAPLHVRKDAGGDTSQSGDSNQYRVQFEAAERSIVDFLAHSRQRIIANQLYAIMLIVLHDIDAAIESRASEYKSRREYLETNRLMNLNEYVQSIKTAYRKALSSQSSTTKKQLLQDLSSTVSKLNRRIEIDIVNVANKTELRSVLEGNMLSRIRANLASLGDRIDSELESIVQCAQDTHAAFQADFLERYRVLDVLGGSVTSDRLNKELAESINVDFENAGVGTSSIVTSVNRSQTSKHVGAGAGAIIGSFITPGIGTVIGGAAGWLVGSVFGPGLSALKQQALQGTKTDIEAIQKECERLIDELVAAYDSSTMSQLDEIVDSYSSVYSTRVQELMDELAAEKKRLDQYTKDAEQDIAIIKERTAAVNSHRNDGG